MQGQAGAPTRALNCVTTRYDSFKCFHQLTRGAFQEVGNVELADGDISRGVIYRRVITRASAKDLVNIIRARHLERRRELIAQNIEQARAEYARGEFNRGTVEDLMKEFNRGTVEDLMKELTEDRDHEGN